MNAITIQGPRLPYHPAVQEKFGLDQGAWRVLTDAVFPAASRPESVMMALAYCKARNLDIFKKPVQIVPIWDAKRREMVDTVWPGIAELRTTAMRTGSFAGFDDTAYGPMIEEDLGGKAMRYPEWAQCTVYRMMGGQRVPFVGPKVFWIETYATAKRDTSAPNSMWAKRPRGQLEKCAEAAALRRAFPEELGNEYAAEEVEGQAFGAGRQVEPTAPQLRQLHSGFEPEDAAFEPADDHIPDFDATRPQDPASEQPASDGTTQPLTDAGDQFPGDTPTSGEKAAAPADAEGTGAAVDVLARADKAIAGLPFMGLADLKQLQATRSFKALLAAIRAQDPTKADQVEKALTDALESFG